MIRQEVNEYSETISSVNLANKNKLSQIDEELKITIDKRSLGVITKDNELKEKESRYTKKTDIKNKTINISKKVKDVDISIVNLRNEYRNVSNKKIQIANGNTNKHRGQHESGGNKQDDLYINQSTKIKNMNSNEFNKELYTCTSNEKGLIKKEYASSSENLVITPKTSSSLLSSHNRNPNSIVRKATSKSMTKRAKVSMQG